MQAKPTKADAKSTNKTKRVPPVAECGIKKPHRFRPGTVALRSVIRHMKGKDSRAGKFDIPKKRFQLLVREICREYGTGEKRFTGRALEALQHEAESALVDVLDRGMCLAATTARRVTLFAKDMRIAMYNDKKDRSMYFGHNLLTAPTVPLKDSFMGVEVMVTHYVPPPSALLS